VVLSRILVVAILIVGHFDVGSLVLVLGLLLRSRVGWPSNSYVLHLVLDGSLSAVQGLVGDFGNDSLLGSLSVEVGTILQLHLCLRDVSVHVVCGSLNSGADSLHFLFPREAWHSLLVFVAAEVHIDAADGNDTHSDVSLSVIVVLHEDDRKEEQE